MVTAIFLVSARLSRTVSTNTSAVSYSHSPTTVVDHAPADNAAIIGKSILLFISYYNLYLIFFIAGAGAIVVIIFAIPIVLVCIFFRSVRIFMFTCCDTLKSETKVLL